VSDDGLQGLGGNLQQGADPPGLRLAEDTRHFERLALRQKSPTFEQYRCLICWTSHFAHTHTHTHLVRAEADVAELQDGGEDGPDGGDLVGMETDSLEALNQKLEVLLVLLPLQLTGTTLEADRDNVKCGTCGTREEEGMT